MDNTDDPFFLKETLTVEEGFWVMWYFLQEHHELSCGTFDVSDILSASEPLLVEGTNTIVPADSGMIHFWNKALEKYRTQGPPPLKPFAR